MKPRRLLQETGDVHQPFGVGALGAAEQRSHHLLDNRHGHVGEEHLHVQCEGAERCQPAAALQLGEMLSTHDRGLACDHAVAGTVDAPAPVRLQADAADVRQSL